MRQEAEEEEGEEVEERYKYQDKEH